MDANEAKRLADEIGAELRRIGGSYAEMSVVEADGRRVRTAFDESPWFTMKNPQVALESLRQIPALGRCPGGILEFDARSRWDEAERRVAAKLESALACVPYRSSEWDGR